MVLRIGLHRAFKTVFFMATMLGSLLLPSTPLLVAMLDMAIPSLILTMILKIPPLLLLQIHHGQDYNFRSSLLDLFIISVLRSLAIICAYALGGIQCGAYFVIAAVLGLASVAIVAVKACVFLPAATSKSANWGIAMLFSSSFICALGHGVSAYRTSCQAKRKSFLQGDEESNFLCKYTVKLKHKRFRSTAFFGKIDKDEQFAMGDTNSQFMLCRGLQLHYKLFQGSSNSSNPNLNPNSSSSRKKSQYHYHHHPASSNNSSLYLSSQQARRQLTRTGSSSLFFPCRSSNSDLKTPLLSSSYSLPPARAELETNRDLDNNERSILNQAGLSAAAAAAAAADHLVEGDGSKHGVVLVHGFGGGVFSWRHVMGPLARQAGYDVAAFDRPGWGLTSRSNTTDCSHRIPNPYELHSQVDLLLDFCRQLGFTSVVLIGHDDGGLLALMAAAKVSQPQEQCFQVVIRGVVLIGVSLSREIIPAFARVLLHTSLGRHMLRPLLCSKMASRHAWHDASKLTSEVMDLYKVPLHVEGWDQAFAVEARKFSASGLLQSQVTPELLQKVHNLPALLVAGMQDMLVPLQAVETLASKLSKSKLVAIPRCGHLPPEECPGPLLTAVVPFILETLSM